MTEQHIIVVNMNIHTFKDVVTSKRSSLANELDDDNDDNDVAPLRREVEGEEETGTELFNEMGEAIEPFNLKNEREGGGHFDENMNYVFQKERGEIDAWVAEMDEVSMEKAIGEAAQAVKRREAKREQEEQLEANKIKKSSLELRKELLELMQPGETLARAMRRLGSKEDKGKSTAFKRRTMKTDDNAMAVEETKPSAEEVKLRAQHSRQQIHRITELADELMSSAGAAGSSLTGIYEMSFEAIQNSMRLWEYKGLQDEVVYGPFTAQQISQWKAQGYLTGETAVLIRHCGEVQPLSTLTTSSSSSHASSERTGGQKAKFSDSIYDEDDLCAEEQPANKRSKVSFSGDQSTAAPASSTSSEGYVKGPWESSDEVDFGQFLDLDEEQRREAAAAEKMRAQQAQETAKANSSTAGFGASRKAGTGSSSTSAAVAAAMAYDEEDEEEDEEDLGYRRKGGGRHSDATSHMRDDEDEED